MVERKARAAVSPSMQNRNAHFLKRGANYLWREWLLPFGKVAAVVLPLKSAIADVNWVPTGSMKPTILEGDIVFVNKLAYDFKIPFTLIRLAEWSTPSRGDVVVCFSPDDGIRLVKRVVAVPGDTIAMVNDTLILNGRPLSSTTHPAGEFAREIYEDPSPVLSTEQSPDARHWVLNLPSRAAVRDMPELTVPAGKYFLMGDSRDHSRDSRFFGFVDREQIVGRAPGIALSFDKNHMLLPRVSRWFSKFDANLPE